MTQLPRRLQYWTGFLDWYGKDEGYWYFPKGRVVKSHEVLEAFRVLKSFEGRIWSDAQGDYLAALKKSGLFLKRASNQTEQDSTAMARMWKVVFSTLGIAWVEDQERVLITTAGERLMSSNDPSIVAERQVQRYQITNPTIRQQKFDQFRIRPHIFLLDVLLNTDHYLSYDEYTLFLSRCRQHDDLDYVLELIQKWREVSEADQIAIMESAAGMHQLPGRRTDLGSGLNWPTRRELRR